MSEGEGARTRLVAIVRATPGIHTREAAAQVGLAESTATYHLERLEREDRVSSLAMGRRRCWYASACGLCPVLRRAVALLRRPCIGQVAAVLDALPQTAIELAARADVTVAGARWAASELAGAQLVERTRSGRVSLRAGAEICLEKATSRERCGSWGSCAVSRAWRASLATTSPSLCATGSSQDHSSDPPRAPSSG